jgi:sugar/nucleoside kinase (ribokinase family)
MGDLSRDLSLQLPSFPKPDRDTPVESFSWGPGGSAVNMAAALVNLKIPTGIIGRVGRDAEGRSLLKEISRLGVHTGRVQKDPERPTAIRVMPVTPRSGRSLMVSRGANVALSANGLREALGGVRHLHVSGHMLLNPTSKITAIEALGAAREAGATTSLEFTWRAASGASEAIREALGHVTVAMSSASELRIAMGLRQVSRAAEAARELGAEQVAVTLGAGGCRVFSTGGALRVPPLNPADSNSGLAEDHHKAGYIYGMLQGASAAACGIIGNASSAFGGGQPYRSLNREVLLRLVQEAEPQVRGKRQAQAIREAAAHLSRRGTQAKRRKTRRNRNPD